MIIIHTKDTYVRPHKHLGKIEAFHVIKGVAKIVIFDDDGGVEKIIEVGDYSSSKVFYYKIEKPYYHTLLIDSDVFIFHEITSGPFNPKETLFAPWAPKDNEEKEILIFKNDLLKKICEE